METYLNISQAKATFSAVVERAAAGEDFIITKMGKPYAKVTKIALPPKKKLLGAMKDHNFKLTDNFDEWPDDMARILGIMD